MKIISCDSDLVSSEDFFTFYRSRKVKVYHYVMANVCVVHSLSLPVHMLIIHLNFLFLTNVLPLSFQNRNRIQ